MTWLRLDTDFPSHELIGTLAEKLRIDPDCAGMSLIRVWCGFGDYAQDGLARAITDTTLENWAGWRGPRGRFATVFREYCTDPEGKVKGWWRQEKLLAHAQKKREHRPPKKPAKDQQETGAGFSPHDGPDTADNGNGNGTTNSNSVVPSHLPPSDARVGRRHGCQSNASGPQRLDASPIVENWRRENDDARSRQDAATDARVAQGAP